MCEIMCAMSIDWNNARMLRVCVCVWCGLYEPNWISENFVEKIGESNLYGRWCVCVRLCGKSEYEQDTHEECTYH